MSKPAKVPTLGEALARAGGRALASAVEELAATDEGSAGIAGGAVGLGLARFGLGLRDGDVDGALDDLAEGVGFALRARRRVRR